MRTSKFSRVLMLTVAAVAAMSLACRRGVEEDDDDNDTGCSGDACTSSSAANASTGGVSSSDTASSGSVSSSGGATSSGGVTSGATSSGGVTSGATSSGGVTSGATSSGGVTSGATSSGSGGSSTSGTSGTITLDNVVDLSAKAICGALFRCCTDVDQVDYFADYRPAPDVNDSPLEPYKTRLPPDVTLDEPACIDVVGDILGEVGWLSYWVAQSREGLVTFKPEEAEACFRELAEAQCGRPIITALYSEPCLSMKRRGTGPAYQRKMFARTRVEGDTCKPIVDGFGSGVYGSCDPTRAFCCVPPSSGADMCIFNPSGTGTCKATSAEGESCGVIPLQWCATGYECSTTDEVCYEVVYPPLVVNDVCYANEELLGECVNGWCDTDGDGKCHALKQDGDACTNWWECVAGGCNNTICGTPDWCDSRQ